MTGFHWMTIWCLQQLFFHMISRWNDTPETLLHISPLQSKIMHSWRSYRFIFEDQIFKIWSSLFKGRHVRTCWFFLLTLHSWDSGGRQVICWSESWVQSSISPHSHVQNLKRWNEMWLVVLAVDRRAQYICQSKWKPEFRKSPLLLMYGRIRNDLWRQEVFLCSNLIYEVSSETGSEHFLSFDLRHQEVTFLLKINLWSHCW